MEQKKKCPACGSEEIGLGKWGGYATLKPAKNPAFSSGTEVIVEVCTHCGAILGLKAERPEIFKP